MMPADTSVDELEENPQETDHHRFGVIGRTVREKAEIVTPYVVRHLKKRRRVVAMEAFDVTVASMGDAAGIDVIVVSDRVGIEVYGLASTQGVTLHDVVRHVGAVSRGVNNALVLAGLPQEAYEGDVIANAQVVLGAGAGAVLVRGPDAVRELHAAKIPVVGEVSGEGKKALIEAKAVEMSGAFAVILREVPIELARALTKQLHVPTIGVGSGPDCDGQLLSVAELFGVRKAKYAKVYDTLGPRIDRGLKKFVEDVKKRRFPTKRHGFRAQPLKNE